MSSGQFTTGPVRHARVMLASARVCREHVGDTRLLKQVPVWQALLGMGMPFTALTRSLGRLTALGMFEPLACPDAAANLAAVCSRFSDVEGLRAARAHPITLLNALRVYAKGHGDRGSLTVCFSFICPFEWTTPYLSGPPRTSSQPASWRTMESCNRRKCLITPYVHLVLPTHDHKCITLAAIRPCRVLGTSGFWVRTPRRAPKEAYDTMVPLRCCGAVGGGAEAEDCAGGGLLCILSQRGAYGEALLAGSGRVRFYERGRVRRHAGADPPGCRHIGGHVPEAH